MPQNLRVHLLPSLVSPQELAGHTAVVIDVLRATTTIVHALGAGAREVIPCVEVEQAHELATRTPGRVLLGGERLGLPIDGFDLGNSPAEYTPETVAGRTVVMTTTNGTRAIARCREAGSVFIGAFVNFSALCREVKEAAHLDLICAGTRGQITREDALLAGAVVDRLTNDGGAKSAPRQCNDQAIIARDAWQSLGLDLADGFRLNETLRHTNGGRNLRALGQDHDIALAAQWDQFDFLPAWQRRTGAIRVP